MSESFYQIELDSRIMNEWHDFFLGQAGVSGGLVGLLFVAISINLERILEFSALPEKALEALYTFSAVLFVSSLGLVPGQSPKLFGLEILIVGLIFWMTQVRALFKTRKSEYETYSRYALNQIPPLSAIVAGASTYAGLENGIYLVVPSIFVCMIAGIYLAWILLIEIRR